jgi:methylase of polypeptide subunit release factors
MAQSLQRRNATTNEWEVQGEVLRWLNEDIARRPGMGLDKATQEPSKATPKRNDLVVWSNRASESAFLTFELKTPKTPISDATLISDADQKAKRWGAPYFAIWNMQAAELYRTPILGVEANPSHRLSSWLPDPLLNSVGDWLNPEAAKSLRARALEILDKAWSVELTRGKELFAVDASLFVDRLTHKLSLLQAEIRPALEHKCKSHRYLRKELKAIAAAQGFLNFVDDLIGAVAGQFTYRLMGQILFYFALRRKQPSLPELIIEPSKSIPEAFRPYWDEVRRFDYEALYQHSRLDEIVPIPARSQLIVRTLVEELSSYDWNKLNDDVLGAVFEKLIPKDEQHLLGQFYTKPAVADVLVAFTIDGGEATILDPGCGSGTFLMRAYDMLKRQCGKSHAELLCQIWGSDISPFAAELAAINLFRQDMSAFDNFPRIIPRDFFDRHSGERIPFLPAKVGGTEKIEIEVPRFSAILGNPPYLRSQNQDDLDPQYKMKLFKSAKENGINAGTKTDLFAFFIYKALGLMKPGSRIGFVTSASWLNSDYGATLQWLLVERLRLVALISSVAESFFSQVDINTVLLVAEMRETPEIGPHENLRFVTFKKNLADVFPSGGNYWNSLVKFADQVEDADRSFENDVVRVKLVDAHAEQSGLARDSRNPRNWSLYLRAPLSYYELFGDPK